MSHAFRYYLILSLVALGTSLAAVAGWRFARASAPVSGPIVLVTLDGISAERLPLSGETRALAPALDALAADGVVFERAYTHSALTLPAHVSLLSGRLPFDTGVRDDVGHTVPGTVRLISSMLADRGYATAGVVSSSTLREDTGLARGFDFFDDHSRGPNPLDARRGALAAGDTSAETARPSVATATDASVQRVERWLSAVGTTRAFVFLQVRAHSDVSHADDVIGRLVAYLKKQQLYDQATVIVTSSHGAHAGSRGQHGADLAEVDHVMHVPLVIKQAGKQAGKPAGTRAGQQAGSAGAGRRVRQLVQHADIVPTILDLAKAPTPSGLAGQSLRPLLEGDEIAEQIAFGESLFPALHYGWAPVRMVSDGRYQYVSGATSALFDLDVAPGRRTDISAEHPEVTARLARILDERVSGDELPVVTRASTLTLDERDAALAIGSLGPRSLAGDPSPAMEHDTSTSSPVASKPDVTLVESYAAAMREVADRRWTAGIERLRALARRYPSRLDLWASLGIVAERGGRLDVAVDAYRRVLTSAPMAHETRLRLASTLARARRVDEARQHAEMATAAEEPVVQAAAHELLARMAVGRHEPGAARVHAQHVLEVDATSAVPAAIEGRLLFDRGRFDEAVEWFDKAAAQADGVPVLELHLWRAEALLELERQAEAEDALLTEVRLFPESTRPYTTLATLYHAQGRDDEIAPLLSDMTQRLRTPDAFDIAARLWASFGDRARADEARAEARELSPVRRAIPAQ